MLFEDAPVHHDFESGGPRPRGSVFVDYAFLHPNGARADADGCFHNFRNELRAAENIDDIHGSGHAIELRVGLLAQHFGLKRIDRNDAVSRALHVFRDAEAGTKALARETDYGDRSGGTQDTPNIRHRISTPRS